MSLKQNNVKDSAGTEEILWLPLKDYIKGEGCKRPHLQLLITDFHWHQWDCWGKHIPQTCLVWIWKSPSKCQQEWPGCKCCTFKPPYTAAEFYGNAVQDKKSLKSQHMRKLNMSPYKWSMCSIFKQMLYRYNPLFLVWRDLTVLVHLKIVNKKNISGRGKKSSAHHRICQKMGVMMATFPNANQC